MAIPFSGLFRNVKDRFGKRPAAVAEPLPPLAPVEKPDGEKLSKTVMPNATRTVTPNEQVDVDVAAATPTVAIPSSHRMVAVGRTQSAQKPHDLPPAVALALEPRIERTISLRLVDILPRIDADLVKPSAKFDSDKRVFLKAAEIEKGMAIGAPKVLLASIYQQTPDSFMRKIELNDRTEVPLPIDKVLEEFSNTRLRRDQVADEVVPQIDTPFLQATIEDTEKFGTTFDPIMASDAPTVRLTPATAQSIADAEPDGMLRGRFVPPTEPPPDTVIKPVAKTPPAPTYADALPPRRTIAPPPMEPVAVAPAPPAEPVAAKPAAATSSAPLRIPIQLPPNGAGELATMRVPASGEPPVPNRETAPAAPARIPFKLSVAEPPAKTEAASDVAAATPDAPAVEAKTSAPDEPHVTLPLRAILETVPSMQLHGDARSVPPDVMVSFPVSSVQPQLASGRVSIAPKQFRDAMPASYQNLFDADVLDVPVALSLPDVLAHLPQTLLQRRADQEETVLGEEFQTPFLMKAKEDAERFANPNAEKVLPVQADEKPVVEAKPEPVAAETKATKPAKSAPEVEAAPVVAAATHDTNSETLDAKQLVARATELPGISACAVTFTDGLSLAGNIPDDLGIDGITAVAPTLLRRMDKHMENTKLGSVSAMTLHCHESAVTFVTCGNVVVTAVHNGEPFTPDTRRQLTEMTGEVATTYAQQENANVDH